MDSCFYINVRRRLVLLFLLSAITNLACVSAVEEECIYKGEICTIDYQKCLVPVYDYGGENECSSSDILYGPGRIFKTRGEIPFFIVFNENRDDYATPLTYRIFTMVYNSSRNDMDFFPIDACCSVSENDTCILPTLEKHETQHIVFVPRSDETDDYCYYPIFERVGRLKWCDDISPTLPCKSFKNGVLEIYNDFTPLTTEGYTDYCFFEAPSKYIKANRTNTTREYTDEVVNITYGEKDGEIRIDNETHSCELTKNFQKHFARHKRSVNRVACTFVRSSYDNEWDPRLFCTIPLLKDSEPETVAIWVTIVIVLAIAALLIFIVSLSLWIYKKHIKTCFPDYEKTIKELPNTAVIDDSEGQNFIQNNNIKSLNKESEVPDLIVPIDSAKNQIEQPANELKENAIIDDTVKKQVVEEKHMSLDSVNMRLSGCQVSKCKSNQKECNQDETMGYVKKLEFDAVEDVYDGADAPVRKKSDLDSGFPNHVSVCSSPRSCNVIETDQQPALVGNAVENGSNILNDNASPTHCEHKVEKTRKRNISNLDSGFSRSRSVSSSGSSTSSGDVTMTYHQPTLLSNVIENDYDGYTQKDDVLGLDFMPKTKYVKKSRVSESSSGRGSMDEEILLRPGFSSEEQLDTNRIVNTHVENFSPLHDSKIAVITDGYTLK